MTSRPRTILLAVLLLLVLGGLVFWAQSAWRNRLPAPGTPAYAKIVSAFYSGVLALNVGDDDQAKTSLTLATELVPREPAAWADLGLFDMRDPRDDYTRAAQELGRARDLAPKNPQIWELLGLAADKQSQISAAIGDYQQALSASPSDLRARYALIQDLQQQAGPQGAPQVSQQIAQLFAQAPGNLFVALTAAESAARAGDAGTLRAAVARIAAQAASFPPDVRAMLTTAQTFAAHASGPSLPVPIIELNNLLQESPVYQNDQNAVKEPDAGQPVERFILLPNPSAQPAPPDMTTHFTPQPLPDAPPGAWNLARLIALTPEVPATSRDKTPYATDFHLAPTPEQPPTLVVASGSRLQVGAQSLPFPGSAQAPPTPDGVLAVDWRYTFRPGLVCAGAHGLRFYQQGPRSAAAPPVFTDVTAATKLPPAIVNDDYDGAWAADVDLDGDLDIVLGNVVGAPTVLRNNGDGTFTFVHPFSGITNGLRGFAWADFDGDGVPDAALVDGAGVLHVLQNERGLLFRPWALPSDIGKVAALAVADVAQGANMELTVLSQDGTIRTLARRTDGQDGWTETTLAHWQVPSDGSARVRWADLDNNGGADLIATGSAGSAVWMCDAHDNFIALPAAVPGRNLTADVAASRERQDLAGISSAGQPVLLVNAGTKQYHWEIIRPRAAYAARDASAPKPGDQRVNPFGIGGEVDLRAGLLYEKEAIAAPSLHFGLGEYAQADYARIVWPNGSPQGEFALASDETFAAPQRLKGSCPWLFADDGHGMKFVTDFIWRSPLGLRINAQATAGVVQTQDWVKIRGDQLAARNGFYNLAITADLWETHYFDFLRLMTVDHPVGTDVFVDERFAVPPPPLAVYAMTPPQAALRATDDLGHDVTSIVRVRDGVYLDTFGRGPYQGVTRDHYTQLDLGPAPAKNIPQWLVAEGWIHPTDSSINVAISQGRHAPPMPLSLEIPDGRGGWRVARPNLGFPEGKNKTCLLDITGLFPPGAKRIVRLRTNLEIFWDFLGVSEGRPQTPLRMQRLAPAVADLHYRGFSATHQANDSSPETPDYAVIAGTAPRWLDLTGFYTRYGDVRPLLARISDRYVIMNAGDELRLRFAAPPPPPPGWTRDFVLIGDGWVKDGDFNTGFSRTVLPLPSHSRPAYSAPPRGLQNDPVYRAHRQDWTTFQTRYVTPQAFRRELLP